MKKINLLAATAVVFTTVVSTPAFVNPTPSSAGQAAMLAACDAAKPANQQVITGSSTRPVIRNITYATNSVVGVVATPLSPRVVTGTPVLVTPAATVPVLTPPTFIGGSEGRRGGSPNIHGEFVATATYAAPIYSQTVTTYPRTSFAFSCSYDKTTEGTTITNWRSIPADLPLTEEGAGVETTRMLQAAPRVVNHYSDGVICNSPGSKGGSWRPQNGYTGAMCTGTNASITAAFLLLPGKAVTSNSVPTFDAPEGDPVGEVGGGLANNPHVAALIDNDADTVSKFDEEPGTDGNPQTSGE